MLKRNTNKIFNITFNYSADKHILTSASCVKDCNDFVVVIGMRASTRSIEAHIGHPHPGYDSSSHLNDIGIVELDSPIQFGSEYYLKIF